MCDFGFVTAYLSLAEFVLAMSTSSVPPMPPRKAKRQLTEESTTPMQADVLAIGGRMAFTMLAATGVRVGRTQVEEAWIQV